ncbi:MAG TPA: hypothetical protein VE596_04235 [Gaiellaceae bacterium]|nr:hypothetical protein [Gaiellaceae bacterium]
MAGPVRERVGLSQFLVHVGALVRREVPRLDCFLQPCRSLLALSLVSCDQAESRECSRADLVLCLLVCNEGAECLLGGVKIVLEPKLELGIRHSQLALGYLGNAPPRLQLLG